VTSTNEAQGTPARGLGTTAARSKRTYTSGVTLVLADAKNPAARPAVGILRWVMASRLALSKSMRSSEDTVGTRIRTWSQGRTTDEAVAGAACDVCGAALTRGERCRIVWDTGLGGDVVLADLCRRCAADGDRLLEAYGGYGRSAMRLTQPVAAPQTGLVQRVSAMVVRGVLYALIALAVFFVVTFVTSRR
jgi:hypothetical protein